MTTLKRGRPKLKHQMQKEDILRAALELLDKDGPQGLSMRSLAARLKVTPMALYHHTADRSALLRDISDWVYSGIVQKAVLSDTEARMRIEALLIAYHKAVLRHPNLTLSIFADPDAFSLEAQRITQHLMELLTETRLPADNRSLWLDILVDYTHGSTIAAAMNCPAGQPKSKFVKMETEKYGRRLNELLDRIF